MTASIALVACSSSDDDTTPHTCDPLASTSSDPLMVEFDLASDDGKRFVVIAKQAPTAEEGYGERFFYGIPPTLTEYAMNNSGHGKDACGDLFFDFDADGKTVSASFWGEANLTQCAGHRSQLTVGQTETTTLHQSGTTATGLSYLCK